MRTIQPTTEQLKQGYVLTHKHIRWLEENCTDRHITLFPTTYRLMFSFYRVGNEIVVVCDWPTLGRDWKDLNGTEAGAVFCVFTGSTQRMRPAWDMATEYVTERIRQWGRDHSNRRFTYHREIKI